MTIAAETQMGFVLAWMDEFEGEPVRTMARLALLQDGSAIWPVRGEDGCGLEVYVDDILTFLVDSWKPLFLRQTYPVPGAVARPSEFWSAVERRWTSLPAGEVSRERADAFAFAQAHDLSEAVGGQYELPPLWLLRHREEMVVDTGDILASFPLSVFEEAATSLGDAIAARLAEVDDERWGELLRAWKARDEGAADELQAIAAGTTLETAQTLIDARLLLPIHSVREAANDDSEIRMAARMVGGLPAGQIKSLLALATSLPRVDAPDLEELAQRCLKALADDEAMVAHYLQGAAAARVARTALGFGDEERAEPFQALERIGVPVQLKNIELPTLDALSIWGPQLGPAVVINRKSRRLLGRTRISTLERPEARITAAHELCHLVLDRHRALGAVDILDGGMPVGIEQRARAFAAEFMLPARVAADQWRRTTAGSDRKSVDRVLCELMDSHGVTKIVARWQLEHGLNGREPEVVFWLDQLAPARR